MAAGWGYQKIGIRKRAQDGTLCYSIPYSEHSSWLELRRCVKAFAPKRLIPTVNVGDKAKYDRMVAKFADLMDLRESKSHMDRYCIVSKHKVDKSSTSSPQETRGPDCPTDCTVSPSSLIDASPNKVGSDSTTVLPGLDSPQSVGCTAGLKRVSGIACSVVAASKSQKLDYAVHKADPEADAVWYDGTDEFDVCEVFDL